MECFGDVLKRIFKILENEEKILKFILSNEH